MTYVDALGLKHADGHYSALAVIYRYSGGALEMPWSYPSGALEVDLLEHCYATAIYPLSVRHATASIPPLPYTFIPQRFPNVIIALA